MQMQPQTPREIALEMLSKISDDDIIKTLKSAGIEQDNIERILNEIHATD